MIDLFGLLKDTGAYKTVKGDKENGRLSHAYLILTPDGANLGEYLKIFARLAFCNFVEPCFNCRACKLIEENAYSDLIIYPKKETVLAEDINSLIEESYLKPVEADKKIFIINHAETMNASAQNKLLKTLEEPPKGVHIFLGATSEFPLLPTVLSRVKKLEIPAFSAEKLKNALKEECPVLERLESAVACGDGTVGKALSLYGDENLKSITDLAVDILVNMKSSKDLLFYSTKVLSSKCDLSEFLSVLELLLRDMLMISQGKEDLVAAKSAVSALKKAERFKTGAIIHALECITEANKRKKFNANPTMLVEWLLFQILEGKYKWQKS